MNSAQQKQTVAQAMSARILTGQLLFIGEGSTVRLVLEFLKARILNEGLVLSAIAASPEVENTCNAAGIKVHDFASYDKIENLSLGFDGADEVDEKGRLIKGGGGHLLRERLLAETCKLRQVPWYVLVDSSKCVQVLGAKFPLPIEVIPQYATSLLEKLQSLGQTSLRNLNHKPFITTSGNNIIDVKLNGPIEDSLDQELKAMTGVVDHGLFVGLSPIVMICKETGAIMEKHYK